MPTPRATPGTTERRWNELFASLPNALSCLNDKQRCGLLAHQLQTVHHHKAIRAVCVRREHEKYFVLARGSSLRLKRPAHPSFADIIVVDAAGSDPVRNSAGPETGNGVRLAAGHPPGRATWVMVEPGTRTGGKQRRRGRYQRGVGLSSGIQAEFVMPRRRGPRLGRTKSSARRLRDRRIGDREVACLRATHRRGGATSYTWRIRLRRERLDWARRMSLGCCVTSRSTRSAIRARSSRRPGSSAASACAEAVTCLGSVTEKKSGQ